VVIGNAGRTRRLAVRHLVAVIVVTVLISGGELLYEVRTQYRQGLRELQEVLDVIQESYLPSVAAGVFFFDDHQLQLLAEGMTLLPFVDSVTVLEGRSEGDVIILSTQRDDEPGKHSEIHEYPLFYRYRGQNREIGALRVTTNMDRLQRQILDQLTAATVANSIRILGFAVVILVVVQRMVFRHLRKIALFFNTLDPEEPGKNMVALGRSQSLRRKQDELDEIVSAVNGMLSRQDRVMKEKAALVQELFHRTGNTVQSIQAILNLQSARYGDNLPLQTAIRAVHIRILAISLAHQKLYLGQDLSRVGMKDYLLELADEVFRSYQAPRQNLQLRTDIADFSLLIDTAVPCGMIVCELLSNSLEHAFSSEGTGSGGTPGVVTVFLGSAQDGTYLLTVSDNGMGPGEHFDVHRDGKMGIQVVLSTVESQLQGHFEIEVKHGMRWSIRFSDSVYRERVAIE
jgi:two-component sensor histidine kinase